MSSNINYLSINENFPVAGQDNDTQTFRDNFDTIKTSFRNAKDEITDLQDNAARTDVDINDFNLNSIQNAVFQNNRVQTFDGGEISTPLEIDYQNGNYQTFKIASSINVEFTNFPGDTVYPTVVGMGKVTLELYKAGATDVDLTFITSGGTVIKKNGTFPETVTLDSTDDPIFIEVWRRNSAVIYMNYLGKFV